MASQGDGISSNLKRDQDFNRCVPLINKNVYEASCGSLPDVQTVSTNLLRADTLNRPIIELSGKTNVNDENSKISTNSKINSDEKISGNFFTEKSQLCIKNKSSKNKPDRRMSVEDFGLIRAQQLEQFIPKGISSKLEEEESESELGEWKTIRATERQGHLGKKIHKSANNCIKIKLSFNPESFQKSYRERCMLEIELNGSKTNSLKVTNNKTTQINSRTKFFEDKLRMNNKTQIMNLKKIHLLNTYTSIINNASMKFEETKASNKSSFTQPETLELKKLRQNGNNVCSSLSKIFPSGEDNNSTINTVVKDISESQQFVSGLKSTTINFTNNSRDKNEKLKSNSIYDRKDECVQTAAKRSKEQNNINEDQDMIKLGMWLEILNNSEYNNYNQDLGLPLQNDKIKIEKSRISENEREFQSFVKELEQEKSMTCSTVGVKTADKFSKENDTVKPKKIYDIHAHNQKLPKVPLQNSFKHTNRTSMESIDLKPASERFNNAKFEGTSVENTHNNENGENLLRRFSIGGSTNDTSLDSPFRKRFQSLIKRLILGSSDKEEKPSVKPKSEDHYSLYTMSEKSSSLWNKINPFRFCFLKSRAKEFPKTSEENRRCMNKPYNTTSNTVHYCCLSSNDLNDINDYRTQADTINSFCNCNSCFNEGYPIYYPSNIPSKFTAIKYSYDPIPFKHVQCPGGCSLCNPEPNNSQFKHSYY